jgi:Ca2+-binding RTX toxin-like protein
MHAARRITPIVVMALLSATTMLAAMVEANARPRTRCTLKGTSGDDRLVDTGGANVICAFAGNDVVEAGPAADRVYGGKGNDQLEGNDGKDVVFGSRGNDTIVTADGVGGNDRIRGGPGQDTCFIDRGDKTRSCETKNVVT